MSSTYNPSGSSSIPGASTGSTSESNTSQSDFSKLQEEIASLKDQLTKIVSTAGSEAAKSVHSMASQVSDAASGAMDTGAKMQIAPPINKNICFRNWGGDFGKFFSAGRHRRCPLRRGTDWARRSRPPLMLAKFLGLFGFDLNRQIQLLKKRVRTPPEKRRTKLKARLRKLA